MTQNPQIKGLPAGATVEPINSSIKGLPPGATVEPLPQGATFGVPSPKTSLNDTVNPSAQLERAKTRDYPQDTSMSAGGVAPPSPTDPYAVKPNTLKSFFSSAGIPTSEPDAKEAMRGILTPQADPTHDAISRAAEHIPIIGGDQRARYDLYNRGDKEGGLTGLVHKTAAFVPFAGPAVSAAQDKFDQGDYSGAAGAGVNAFLSIIGLREAAVKPTLKTMGVKETPTGTLTEHPNAASPSQLENLNSLRPGRSTSVNMEGTDQVATSVRNAAAKMTGKEGAADLKFKGSNVKQRIAAGEQVPKAAQEALNTHESIVQRITSPYENSVVSTQPVADSIRAQITPEMRAAAQKNPKLATQIQQIEDLAAENDGQHSIKDVNARRQRYNDDLAPLYDKTQQAQSEAPAVMQAKKAGANALRNVQYDTLSDLSGTDIRPLKQREADLIDYKADVNKRLAQAANSRANVQPGYLGRVSKAVSKTNPLKETSTVDILKTILGGRDITPIEEFNASAQRGLSNLAPYQPPNMPPIPHEVQSLIGTQEPLPTIRGPLFDIQQTPDTKAPSSPAIPAGEEKSLLTPGKGKGRGKASPYQSNQPVAVHVSPQDRAAMEKAPYGGFRVGSDEIPNYGQTRRPLVGEEYPQIVPPEVVQASSPTPSTPPAKLPPVSGGSDRGAGLAARGDKGSVIPERGKGFVTNEAAERRALPRSTQAQLLTSEANEIRRSIQEATTPEEKAYHQQRLQMKLEEIDKLGLPPELHSAIQAAPKIKAAKK